ncbi:MAG: transglycosylase domain-containing protein [Flavobacteriales bacterium]|nr:transglycosylase domain-containing protein [Flavobacteriales bacterium]
MAKTKSSPTGYRKWLFFFWCLVVLPFVALGAVIFFASNGKLPPTEALANPKTNLATEVYTSDMEVIGRYYRENRSDVAFENLPPHLVDALIATEDARFYDHAGVDFIGLIRAAAYLGKKGGGSTITQQLAKMLFTEGYENISFLERAWQKPQEWIIATRLEKQYTKNEIITLYLNRYDFLNQAVGIKSASHVYFNKPVDSLRVEEAAMLVGMLKNSALFNPLRRADTVLYRRNVVLNQMVKYGSLDESQYDSLRLLPLNISYQRVSHDEGLAPYFREILRMELKKILKEEDENGNLIRTKPDGSGYDVYSDGLKVFTTIDSRMQAYAEKAVSRHLGGELQDDFWDDLKRRKDSKWPFANTTTDDNIDRILTAAVKQSERYRVLSGNTCPECKRPAFYIHTIKGEDGHQHYHCDDEKGGCGHTWPVLSDDEIETNFNTSIPMKVFSWKGDIDTVMTPMDSIRYHKSILHAGVMAMDPTSGHIKVWVGGIDYKHFQYDNVYQSRRQVGSTFKPFVYATALRFGEHPCTEYPNQKICIDMPDGQPQWCPDNSDFEYGEMVSLEYALANSINTITAKLIKKYGPGPVIQLARELGIKSAIPEVPSIALGVAELSLHEMVAANAALVNQGTYIEPIFISRIEDKNGHIIYEADLNIQQALDTKTAYLTVQLMKGVVDGAYNREKGKRLGTGMRLRMDLASRDYDGIKVPMAGKTGTTNDNSDGWFMGLTPELVTGVWVGAADPVVRFTRTSLGQGANMALPIYGYFMKEVYNDKELNISQKDFKKPDDVEIDIELDCMKYFNTTNSINFGGKSDDEGDGLFE